MFIIKNLLVAISQGVDIFLSFLYWVVIIRVLLSWVSPDPSNPIVQFIYRMTEPLLERIRRFLPVLPIDFSPWIVIVLIYILKNFIINVLMDIAYSLK